MKPRLFIRIAAVLMFLHTIGHTLGTFNKSVPNATIGSILQQMAANHFTFMGRQASLAIFFEGYGVCLILFLLLASLLLWFISSAAETPLGGKLLMLSSLFLVGLTVIEVIYCFPFFLTPLAAICTIIAQIQIRKTNYITT
jgi:hypothetical protein